MKSNAFIVIFIASLLSNIHAAEITSNTEAVEPEAEVNVSSDRETVDSNTRVIKNADFCFLAGMPPSDIKYTIIRKLKVGKGSYGGVKDILPKLADRARQAGADAMIQYTGSQRFGFFPWRVVRPVVRGTAIKWNDPQKPDCSVIGGSTLKTILDTDKAPAQ